MLNTTNGSSISEEKIHGSNSLRTGSSSSDGVQSQSGRKKLSNISIKSSRGLSIDGFSRFRERSKMSNLLSHEQVNKAASMLLRATTLNRFNPTEDGVSKMVIATTWSDRLIYKFDSVIETTSGQTLFLTLTGMILLLVLGGILQAIEQDRPFAQSLWDTWTYLAYTGTHTSLKELESRLIATPTTIIGILYFSVIMGFIVDGIRAKMDTLKRGRSMVAEDKHTLILGWNDKTISLIKELCIANKSEHGGVITILAEIEKETIEAEFESRMTKEELRGSEVVFRTGTHLHRVDLVNVSAQTARSIIIMASNIGDADQSDSHALRTVLTLMSLRPLSGHIVVEIRDIDNAPLIRLVGGDFVEVVVSHDIIGRLILMSARSPGLATVFSHLLGFEGSEFYMKAWPECTGIRFGSLIERFPNAIPLGLKKAASGKVVINPPMDECVAAKDEIIVLAEDDDTYECCPTVMIPAGQGPNRIHQQEKHEKVLMCGWRRDVRDMIAQLDQLVLPGTELHMICEEPPIEERNRSLADSGLNVNELKNLKIVHFHANPAIRRHMEVLPLHTYTSIMILADQFREHDIMHSDSHTLASLLTIRDLQVHSRPNEPSSGPISSTCKCISELLDPRTQKTTSMCAPIQALSEFIQSNELMTSMLAMVAENRHVHGIIDELL